MTKNICVYYYHIRQIALIRSGKFAISNHATLYAIRLNVDV